jgi:hypothetical protein
MFEPKRNLILSPIGDESVHRGWLSEANERGFDLFLIYYGDRADYGREDAHYYIKRKGFKWELVGHALEEHADVLDHYANIWIPDNDIRADTHTINRMFDLFDRYHLQLAQPAITRGEVSYQTFRQSPGVLLRYTPLVEVMCPLFTREALSRVAFSFEESRSGWGLDWLWPRYFLPREVAILDGAGVEHVGQLFRGENYRRLADLGIFPAEDFQRVIDRHGGFNRRLHRRLVRGRVRLPEIRDPAASHGLWSRWFSGGNHFPWRRSA